MTLTTLPHLVTPGPDASVHFGDLENGTIIEEAEVVKVDQKVVMFKLNKEVMGVATVSTHLENILHLTGQ